MHPKQRHACKAQPAQKHIGQYDPHQRIHADEPPDAVVQVAQPEHRQADRHPPPDGVQISVHKLLGNIRKVEVEPCPQGQQVRAHDADDVRQHDQEHPGQPPAIHFSYVQAHPAAPPFSRRSHPPLPLFRCHPNIAQNNEKIKSKNVVSIRRICGNVFALSAGILGSIPGRPACQKRATPFFDKLKRRRAAARLLLVCLFPLFIPCSGHARSGPPAYPGAAPPASRPSYQSPAWG